MTAPTSSKTAPPTGPIVSGASFVMPRTTPATTASGDGSSSPLARRTTRGSAAAARVTVRPTAIAAALKHRSIELERLRVCIGDMLVGQRTSRAIPLCLSKSAKRERRSSCLSK